MTEYRMQPRAPRIPLPDRAAARTRASETVRLLDVSLTGARLEHLKILRPGAPCTLELPPALGALVLVAQVVWSRVVGTEASLKGERRLRYQSGLLFSKVTAEQQSILGQALEAAAPGVALNNGGLSL